MKTVLIAVLLFVCGGAQSSYLRVGAVYNTKPITGEMSIKVPEDYREILTFYAPLKENLLAYGRGSDTPTYTGGGMTGAGSMRSYEGCDGLIHWASAGPVFDCGKGYQSMGARTNLLKDNVGFVNGWTPINMRVPASTMPAIVYPDGTSSTLGFLAEDATNGAHYRAFTYTSTDAKAQAGSVYAKAGGRAWLYVDVDDGGTGGYKAWFNLSTGAVGTNAGFGSASHWWGSASISPGPLGYYRCVVLTGTASGTSKRFITAICSADNTISYQGDNSSSLFIWGAQVEDNATFPSPVILTVATTGARGADVLTYGSAGNFNWTAPSTIVGDAVLGTTNIGVKQYAFSAPTANQSQSVYASETGALTARTFSSGTNIINLLGTTAVGTKYRYALASQTNYMAGYLGSSLIGSLGTLVMPDGSQTSVSIGGQNGTTNLFGNSGTIRLFTGNLSSWELGLIK